VSDPRPAGTACSPTDRATTGGEPDPKTSGWPDARTETNGSATDPTNRPAVGIDTAAGLDAGGSPIERDTTTGGGSPATTTACSPNRPEAGTGPPDKVGRVDTSAGATERETTTGSAGRQELTANP
jgi:hypothetical protein